MDIDVGFKSFREIIDYYEQRNLFDANEAETRKLVIDSVLEKVLGWDPVDDIGYEERVSEDGETTFADYVIKTANTSIVVEAKRAGKTFRLPINKTSGVLGGVLSAGDIGRAIVQVRDYARKLSIPFAIATNGSSWVVFPAIRTDGVSFGKTTAHIFKDLIDIRNRFVDFWELLSRQRVIEGNLESAFFGKEQQLVQRRIISLMKEPGYRVGRNRIYEHIEPAVSLSLTDEAILNDNEGLSICYVKSSERVKYDSRLKMHLSDVLPQLDRKVVRPRFPKKSDHLDQRIESSINKPNQFLLILGPVGAGKTTFLNYTSKVSAAHIISKGIFWFYIDFKKATDTDEPRNYIYNELLEFIEKDSTYQIGEWNSSIKFAYEDVINVLKKGALALIYQDDKIAFNKEITNIVMDERNKIEPFVNRVLKYVSRAHSIYLVVDNVDQIEDESVQKKIFIETQAIARRINSNVILSLRDSTYSKYRETPIFDAFQVDALYIDPPQVLPVLSRRFAYAKKTLEKKSAEIVSESGLRFKVEDLSVFFDIVSSSLLSEDSGYLLEVMSGGNIRRGLKLVREFLSSGHTTADRAIMAYATDGKYHFPFHEVFRGCFLGQRKYYREEESLLPNIYDSRLKRPATQLLRLQLLYNIVRMSSDSSFEGVEIQFIKSEFYKIGVSNDEIDKIIFELINYSLISTSNGEILKNDSKIIATRFGGYLMRKLSYEFMYLEPCVLDASIYDDDEWLEFIRITEQINVATNMAKIHQRIDRVRRFIDYLIGLEQKMIVDCKRFNLSSDWDNEIISKYIRPHAETNFLKVERSASNQYKRIQ